jgi:hypothetical protein
MLHFGPKCAKNLWILEDFWVDFINKIMNYECKNIIIIIIIASYPWTNFCQILNYKATVYSWLFATSTNAVDYYYLFVYSATPGV